MRYRVTPMYDIYTGKVVEYMVYAQIKPRQRWMPCMDNDGPLHFPTPEACQARIDTILAEIEKRHAADN